jgi:hypothetical protein
LFVSTKVNEIVEIEDLYSSTDLKRKHDGKSFSKSKTFNKDREYGKMDFATKVIAKNFESVDFSGFRDLLSRMQKAVEDYHARRTKA